jgi:hypothetical protein
VAGSLSGCDFICRHESCDFSVSQHDMAMSWEEKGASPVQSGFTREKEREVVSGR